MSAEALAKLLIHLPERLPPQAGGFEGLLTVVECLHTTDLAVCQGPQGRVDGLYRSTAGASNFPLAHDRHNLVARVDQLLGVQLDLTKGAKGFAPALPDPLVSVKTGVG